MEQTTVGMGDEFLTPPMFEIVARAASCMCANRTVELTRVLDGVRLTLQVTALQWMGGVPVFSGFLSRPAVDDLTIPSVPAAVMLMVDPSRGKALPLPT